MTSDKFAEIFSDVHQAVDAGLVQNLSMFFNAEQREEFLDFIGVDY